jgi:putative cell wall-binding protein
MLRRSPFRLTFACALVLALVPASPALAAMSRSVVMQRAEQWVAMPIPYSQTGWADIYGTTVYSPSKGWRRDCSGFTSMAWNLPKPGASTRTLHFYSDQITKAALQPGDAMVSYDNHALIFGGWADDAHTTYYAYEMSSSASKNSTPTPDGTITRVTPYPYWGSNASTYLPYRLKGITENIDYGAYITPVEGSNRYATALAASRTAFTDGSAKTAIVASGENWPDALGASALAGAVGGPVLLTKPDALPAGVAAELARLGVTEVIVVGGTGAVRPSVASALDALPGVSVTRIGGSNRYATARLIAEETGRRVTSSGGTPDPAVFVATGANFPDALAASPIAYAKTRPIVLTTPASLSSEAAAAITALGTSEVVILGGTGPVSSEVETRLAGVLGDENVSRLAGADRYATGYAIAVYGHDECDLSYSGAGVATGASFPDALAGGAMAGKLGTVMLLTPTAKLDGRVAELMLANRTEFGKPHCLGGLSALKPIVREAIACMLSDR